MGDFETVIGLEIHVKLNSPNKLFCRCKNEQSFEDEESNTNICPVCVGQPGALLVLNEEPLRKAVLLWLALHCEVKNVSSFDRKSYFYPDLPMWYQITQLYHPTNMDGYVEFFVDNFQKEKKIRVERAHIESDAGKTIHAGGKAMLDFNRAATPLVEIVTYPDFRDDEEVVEFLKELQRLVRYNDIWYADLEKGQMRCDVNVSLRPVWTETLWTKVEIKNMSSFSAIRRAILHEVKRQGSILDEWWSIDQETRWWNDVSGSSYTMRSKEDALDYRYFPEPDLPVVKIEDSLIQEIKQGIVKSSFERVKSYKSDYWFHKEFINPLISDIKVWTYFERLVESKVDPKIAVKWVVNILLRRINDENIGIDDIKFSFEDFLYVLQQLEKWDILENQAKDVFRLMWDEWKTPQSIIEEKWYKPQDSWELDQIVKKVLDENPDAFNDIKSWNMKAIGFLIWQVMKLSQWKANPKVVKELIQKEIK